MKYDLLDLTKTENKVHGRNDANHYDISYDFASDELKCIHNAEKSRKISSYIMDDALINAVNAAIVTGRPLLIKGEPGCGKTKLAQATANHFFKEDAYKYYFEWHVKSKSKAKDGAYSFDHVGRMRDASISAQDPKAKARAANEDEYIELGPLGLALKTKMEDNHAKKKPILLIDEIDKGDIDFPNDLLLELDEMRFKINEKKTEYYIEPTDGVRPLIFITSNNERELPPAFLRRCLYYYIEPFSSEILIQIAKTKMDEFYDELNIANKDLVDPDHLSPFVEKFLDLKKKASGSKAPSTSEMLDWLKLLTFQISRNDKSLTDMITDPGLQKMALKLNAS